VQIVEATDGWVRVAELRLRRRGAPLEFVLYPMIHIGDPAFYTEVRRRLEAVDLIVAEGVGDSPTVSGLTSAYRDLGEDPESGLVVQDDVFPPGVPLLCPDSSGAEFDARWATVPLLQRGAVWAGLGVLRGAHRVLGARWMLRRYGDESMDDLPMTEVVVDDLLDDVERVVLRERDARLLEALGTIVEERSADDVTVAVVFPQPSAGRCPQAPSTCAPSSAAWGSETSGSTPASG